MCSWMAGESTAATSKKEHHRSSNIKHSKKRAVRKEKLAVMSAKKTAD